MIYETVNEEVTTVVMWVVQIITYQGGGEGGGGRAACQISLFSPSRLVTYSFHR